MAAILSRPQRVRCKFWVLNNKAFGSRKKPVVRQQCDVIETKSSFNKGNIKTTENILSWIYWLLYMYWINVKHHDSWDLVYSPWGTQTTWKTSGPQSSPIRVDTASTWKTWIRIWTTFLFLDANTDNMLDVGVMSTWFVNHDWKLEMLQYYTLGK